MAVVRSVPVGAVFAAPGYQSTSPSCSGTSKGFDGMFTVSNNCATAVSPFTSRHSWRASSCGTNSFPAPAVAESIARVTVSDHARSAAGS